MTRTRCSHHGSAYPSCRSSTGQNDEDDGGRLHWKTRRLVEWAAGRRFAWVDDEITDADRTWVAANHSASALLHRVDPRRGPTDADYQAVAQWLNEEDL